ncbi:MAG: heterodisulfide reductase-related iron-sulfur binding cluster [Bilophila wadsworthia]|uniref:heterodisulfide reductase-related iron-sulfur binding cluster n=1 Tax=Bilophila wadsworthia TaxID=35833 RepID=UPI00300F00D9
MDRPAGKSSLRRRVLPGCMGENIYTGMSEACLKVFEPHGVGVFLSDNFACCGIPALVSGDREGIERRSSITSASFRGPTSTTL